MAKMKIYDIARSLQEKFPDLKSKDLIELLNKNGFEAKSAQSSIEDAAIGFLLKYYQNLSAKKKTAKPEAPKEEKREQVAAKKEAAPKKEAVSEKKELGAVKSEAAPKKEPDLKREVAQKPETVAEAPKEEKGGDDKKATQAETPAEEKREQKKEKQEKAVSAPKPEKREKKEKAAAPKKEQAVSGAQKEKGASSGRERRESGQENRQNGNRNGGNRNGNRDNGHNSNRGNRNGGRDSGYNNNRGNRDGGGRDGNRDNRQGGFGNRGGRPQGNDSRRSAAAPMDSMKSEVKQSRQQRANKDSRSAKQRHGKDRGRDDFDEEAFNQNKQARKKKDPNRKGAFIKPEPVAKPAEPEDGIRNIVLPEKMTIKELADIMKVPAATVIKKLFLQGNVVSLNHEITYDEAEEIALEYNCIAEMEEKVDLIAEILKEDEEDESLMKKRPPVVCVMGHVDHGKTSLLDAIREAHVTDKEAGGITQHIGAYVTEINGEKITFLDTPGHEAFTSMRMRGAQSTDIAILVVAADEDRKSVV